MNLNLGLADALSFYVNLNFLIVLGFAVLFLLSLSNKTFGFLNSARDELRLHNLVFALVLVFSLAHLFFPRPDFFQPAAKVWSAQSIGSFSEEYLASGKAGFLSLPTLKGTSVVKADSVLSIWLLIGIGIVFWGSFYFVRDLRRLLSIKRRSFLFRKIGRIQVFINDDVSMPFSYWLPGEANVVIPSNLLTKPSDMQMAIKHELQHHRQGDTRLVYLQWGMRLICFLNPALYFWNRWVMEIQEFACDEALIGRRRIQSHAYARCLLEVAQTAVDQKRLPVCATGFTFRNERNLLKRRIERMFSNPSQSLNRKRITSTAVLLTVGILMSTLLAAAAYASKGLVRDRRVNMAQAKAMAIATNSRAQAGAGLPVVVNDLVLKELNRYIGTPEGREFMRSALARMANHKVMVNEALEKYQVPFEVLALPIVESGYQNFAEGEVSTTNKSAGIWQFIPQTARNFGLRVDTQKDERLDTVLLTDAAMRYLQANNLRFKDWQLSLMAYNMGENAVQKAMTDLDTRDAWTLIRNGREGDKAYLAKFMAAVLIMRNPDSVE